MAHWDPNDSGADPRSDADKDRVTDGTECSRGSPCADTDGKLSRGTVNVNVALIDPLFSDGFEQ